MADDRPPSPKSEESAEERILRENPADVAQALSAQVGAAALKTAIHQQAKAHGRGDESAAGFWSQVCFALVQRTVSSAG